MIRERHVILKAALHSGLYSCLAAASYIIMLYCLDIVFKKINVIIIVLKKLMLHVVWGTYIIIAIFIYLHSQAPALYIIMIL